MGDFYQTGLVATFHRFGKSNLERLEGEIMGYARQRPITLVLPTLYSEIEGPALPRIVEELKNVNYLHQIIVTMGRTDADQFRRAMRFFAQLPQKPVLIWNTGQRVTALYKQLELGGMRVGEDGKGRSCWMAFGYTLACGRSQIIALHDCDITTYSRELLARLVYPGEYHPILTAGSTGRNCGANPVRRRLIYLLLSCFSALVASQLVLSKGKMESPTTEGTGHGLDPTVLVGVAVILIAAKLGGELFERFKQPAVLGELVGGILVGNLALFGLHAADSLRTNEVIGALAEIGVIILLFEVGLESDLGAMIEVGWSSLLVALAGVIAPFLLGWGVAAYYLPGEARLGHIFIGATLCATSVGITARVLKDMGKLQTRESRIILGAAVIDDILGLLILAVVAGAIKATATGVPLSFFGVVIISAKALGFLFGAIVIGHYIVPQIFRHAGYLESRGVLLALAISFCFLLAWAASVVGLAPIVGAFAAGLVLDEAHFESFRDRGEHRLDELLRPVSALLVPIFFVLMGMKVELGAFAKPELLGFAAMLTVAAIIGKQVCSLAVLDRGLNRFAVGLGMIPRGEVGLIFAGIGATLMLPNAQGVSEPVIGPATVGVVVMMVIVTTLVTPPALKWSLQRSQIAKATVSDGGDPESSDKGAIHTTPKVE